MSTGDTILPSQHNPPLTDIASSLTNSLARTGAGGMLAALDMGGYKISNAAQATVGTDLARFDQVFPSTGGTISGDLTVTGSTSLGALVSTGAGVSTGAAIFEHGGGRSGSGNVHFDLHATASSDYEARLIRLGGANGELSLINTGAGTLYILQAASAAIDFQTNSTSRLTIAADGSVTAKGSLASVGAIYPGNDNNFYLNYTAGFPTCAADVNDYWQFDRSGNAWTWYIGASLKFYVNSTGIFDGNNLELGYKDCPQNAQSGAYTLALTDRGKDLYLTGSGALTIPPNSSVAFPLGTTIAFTNDGSSRTLTQGAGVTIKFGGSGASGNRTLGAGSMGAIKKVATDTWYVSGAGGLGGIISLSDASPTDIQSGSTATATYSLLSNGNVVVQGFTTGAYCDPTSLAALLECRMTVLSGALSSGPTESWVALTSNRAWTLVNNSPSSILDATATIEIREAATGLVRTSATISFEAEVV